MGRTLKSTVKALFLRLPKLEGREITRAEGYAARWRERDAQERGRA